MNEPHLVDMRRTRGIYIPELTNPGVSLKEAVIDHFMERH